jgi:hypothetical protein
MPTDKLRSERRRKASGLKYLFTEPIRTLFATQPTERSETALPEGLRIRYDGNLSFPPAPEERPYYIANFVSTLEGVARFNLRGRSEGAQISKSNEEDRFIMSLLRASADAVVVGSGRFKPPVRMVPSSQKLSIRQRKLYTNSIEPRCSEAGVSTRSDCHGNG